MNKSLMLLAMAGTFSFAGKNVMPAQSAVADVEVSGYSLGLKAGTLGVGMDLGYRINNHFGVRLNLNGLYAKSLVQKVIDKAVDKGNIDITNAKPSGTLSLLTAGVLADYYLSSFTTLSHKVI